MLTATTSMLPTRSLMLKGLLERDFVERIHAHLHPVQHHAAAVGFDARTRTL